MPDAPTTVLNMHVSSSCHFRDGSSLYKLESVNHFLKERNLGTNQKLYSTMHLVYYGQHSVQTVIKDIDHAKRTSYEYKYYI